MPRQKQVNHKGKTREFTPADELQQELEEYMKGTSSKSALPASDDEDERKSTGGDENQDKDRYGRILRNKGVHSLIEISNPNRSKPRRTWKDEIIEKPLKVSSLKLGRGPQPQRRSHSTKRSNEMQADMARLAVVRQERQKAAQRRLEITKGSNALKNQRSESISPNDGALSLKKCSYDRGAYVKNSAEPQKLNTKAMLKKE